jgi:hypothetical protein
MNPPVIHGTQPRLIGHTLDAVLAEYMSTAGETWRQLTVVYLKSQGSWVRLALDAGTVHWKRYETEPTSWELPEEGFFYNLEDVGTHEKLLGGSVTQLNVDADGIRARVEIELSDGRSLLLVNEDDETNISICGA